MFWLDLHLASRRNTGTDMSYTQDTEEKVARGRGIERRNTHILDILAVRSISYGRVIGPAAARSDLSLSTRGGTAVIHRCLVPSCVGGVHKSRDGAR